MTYKVVSISNKQPTAWYYLQRQFFTSLGEHPHIMITGGGDYGNWGGLASKPKWLYKAIKDGVIKEDYIIFVDNWDLIFCADPKEMMERYFSFDADIVISAERNCFPADLREEFDKVDAPTDYKYLNSGCIVGKTSSILTCLEWMDLENLPDDHYDPVNNSNIHPNDQFEWMKIWVKQPVKIALDYYQALSMTLHDAKIEELDFSEKRIKNILTNSYPCCLHFNGGSKDNMSLREPILKHLNLL